MLAIQDGEFLALDEAHYERRDETVNLLPLPDSAPGSGGWTPGAAQSAATGLAQDGDAVAVIGDFDSGATATTLPITAKSGILQVSPGSSYIGLTDPSPVDEIGEPSRYYPSGARTFARLIPSDADEALAGTHFMRDLAIRSVFIVTDSSPYDGSFDSAIGALVGHDARAAGITVLGRDQIDSADTTTPAGYASLAAAIVASGAQAVYVAGVPDSGTVALWQALYASDPGLPLFAPSTLATGPFLDHLGPATVSTYFTSPILPLDQYPRRARAVYAAYRRARFAAPWSPYVLYGYEAMESILDTISYAGADPDRHDVLETYFHLGYRDRSVIGRYRIDARGDTSLTRFEGYSVEPSGSRRAMERLRG